LAPRSRRSGFAIRDVPALDVQSELLPPGAELRRGVREGQKLAKTGTVAKQPPAAPFKSGLT